MEKLLWIQTRLDTPQYYTLFANLWHHCIEYPLVTSWVHMTLPPKLFTRLTELHISSRSICLGRDRIANVYTQEREATSLSSFLSSNE